MTRWLLVAVGVGLVLRLMSVGLHDHPRGDVVLDVGVARSLAASEGFGSGFERGTELVRGAGPLPPTGHADQHAPLWPLLAAPLAALTGSPFLALKLLSLVFGLLLMALTMRLADRLAEDRGAVPDGVGPLAAALTGLGFLAVDASGNGSLYAAQACGVVALVDLLGSPRRSPVLVGLVLGGLMLLNHQCLVLLPLPVLVGALAPGGRSRAGGLAAGLAAVAVALLLQVPWWWRNAAVFGDPLHSVNGLYLLHRFGMEPELAIEGGRAVARFTGALSAGQLLGALRAQVAPNLLYLFNTGLVVFPLLLGVVAAATPVELRAALARRDRRRLAAWGALLALVAVAVLWPATKLRYVVSMLPLVTALGLARLLRPPTRGERLVLVGALLLWVGLLVLTLEDLGDGADARPRRWLQMALLGAVLYALPILVRLRASGERAAGIAPRLPVAAAGLPLVALATLAVMVPPPHTAYHGSALVPDFFDQHAEEREAALGAALAEARDAVAGWSHERAADDGTARRLVGPVGLLAWGDPGLVTLPLGAGTPTGEAALAAVLERHPEAVAVITVVGDGWIDRPATDAAPARPAAVGATWLGGRLRVESAHPAGVADRPLEEAEGRGVIVSRVVR